MKIKTFLMFFAVFIFMFTFNSALSAGEKKKQTLAYGIDYSAGLNFSYNRTSILLGENNVESSMTYTYLALEIDVALLDFLTLGAVAGYNTNYFNDPVDFSNLPLSLRVSEQRYNSMLVGLRAKSDFFSWKEFSLTANGEFLYFKVFKKELPIQLPVVTGTSTVKNSFYQAAVELMVQYDRFSGLTIFAGPQWNMIKGKFTVTETIDALEGIQTLKYKQKNTMGIAAGINFEAGSHFDINAKISLFSKTSFSLEVFYIF